jgi:2-keto-4-pentenoate hydratase/2-oxohepta-3-ene-1,7-dioic acid hydratase in catechol pathway
VRLVTVPVAGVGAEAAVVVPGGYRTLRSMGLPDDVRSFIAAGPAVWMQAGRVGLDPDYDETATLLAPILDPVNIIGIGLNYLDHCREQGIEPPKTPILFAKFRASIAGPDAEVSWDPSLTAEVDYEAELAAVIGKRARYVAPEEALDYVFGYMNANDLSARDLQFGDRQWVRGKSLEGFCPTGPWLVSADEAGDPQAMPAKCWVNGDVMQDSNTSEMIHDVAALVSFCSQAFTLEPGDIILTGTPHGVGFARKPPVFLRPGDEVVVEVGGLGRLVTRVRR